MNQFKSTAKTQVFTENTTIIADSGLNSIYIQNEGDADIMVFDNITITPGSNFSYSNYPGVIIAENIPVTFKGAGAKKASIFKQYIIAL